VKTLSQYVKHATAASSAVRPAVRPQPFVERDGFAAPRRRATVRSGTSLLAYKVSADIVSKSVTLVVTVAAARTLPASDFGVMALAMTTGWLLGVASDAGLPMHLATQVAQAQSARMPVYPTVRAVLRRRTEFAVVAAGVSMVAGLALVPVAALIGFVLIVFHQLLGAMLETLAHAFRGLGRTDLESSLSLAHRGAVALGALTVLSLAPTLVNLGAALAWPPLVALLVGRSVLRRLTADGPPVVLTARRMLTDVAPLGLGTLLSALYFRCDVYFIGHFHGVDTVGLYNASFRIVDALRLFPAAALAVAYPMLCVATDERPLRSLSTWLLAVSAVVAAAVYAAAPALLVFVYGAPFEVAAEALQILAWCLPLFYVNYALTHQLIAWHGGRPYLAIAGVALLTNVGGNALLIPDGGMTGAALSTLLTEVVVLVGCALALVRR
jgi:O-antigen/teichoic acid export membrane protein